MTKSESLRPYESDLLPFPLHSVKVSEVTAPSAFCTGLSLQFRQPCAARSELRTRPLTPWLHVTCHILYRRLAQRGLGTPSPLSSGVFCGLVDIDKANVESLGLSPGGKYRVQAVCCGGCQHILAARCNMRAELWLICRAETSKLATKPRSLYPDRLGNRVTQCLYSRGFSPSLL